MSGGGASRGRVCYQRGFPVYFYNQQQIIYGIVQFINMFLQYYYYGYPHSYVNSEENV